MNSLGASISCGSLFRRAFLDKRICLGVRTLFSDQYLSIDKFADSREITKRQYGNMKDNFMTRMKQQLSLETSMVFTEDLKTALHLVEDTDEDLNLCCQMIKKFHGQNKELRFGTFVFGPVVMRLLHHLRKPDIALQLITDEATSEFFDQVRSYVIVMDLLYENGRYKEVIDLNEKVIRKQLMETKYPRDCILITAAACYKINTPESYEYATKMVTEARQAGAVVVQKAIYFISALALNQDRPDVAMELLSSLTVNNNPLGNNLKLMTLAKLGRLPDAFSILKKKVEEDVPMQAMVRGDICQNTLDVLKEAVGKANDVDASHELEQLIQSLNECNAVSPQTIEGLLSVPIVPRPFVRDNNFGRDRRDQPYFRRDNRPRVRQSYGAGMMGGE